ncbi:MAG: tyrosine--tRNA ligase [Candidatus Peribacteraceae bacterium]|nr:tyrosine--tRNA ligase [Candidatus Peribacteraceae bacterium]MDD5074325.1 tyrosine--tRNA ligase [Candidatus Peribacteraceae bacterium]
MATHELLTRAVEKVVPEKLAEDKIQSGKPLRLYLGIDPTGAKLHIGHSVPLRKLKAFQDAGHEVIFLIGSFTATIGDPSGRNQLREPLTLEQVEKNFQTYKKQAEKILDFSKVKIVYNHEWLGKLKFDEIVKIASNFTVQQMMVREMFQRRIKEDNPIALHEFLYPLMQGYDSVILDVDFEVGGNDQLFNMLCGRTLQQAFGKREKFVLTTRLIEGTDGRKMSKTYNNCVYIEDEPNDMYGKIMSVKDELILTYMECCTGIPMEEIAAAKKEMEKGANPKDHKARLAREIVTLYHGAAAAQKAEAEFSKVFKDKGIPDDVPELKVKKGTPLIDVLVQGKLAPSKSEARRLIEQGGVSIDGKVVSSVEAKSEAGLVKVGKRKFLMIHYEKN